MMHDLAAQRRGDRDALDAKVYAAVLEFEMEATTWDLSEVLHMLPKRLTAPLLRLEERGLVRSWRARGNTGNSGIGPRYYRKVEVAKTGT